MYNNAQAGHSQASHRANVAELHLDDSAALFNVYYDVNGIRSYVLQNVSYSRAVDYIWHMGELVQASVTVGSNVRVIDPPRACNFYGGCRYCMYTSYLSNGNLCEYVIQHAI